MIQHDPAIRAAYISTAGGFITTVLALILGPIISRKFRKSKRMKKSMSAFDEAMIRLQRTVVRRDRTIEYLSSKMGRVERKKERLFLINAKLQAENDRDKNIINELRERLK